MEREKLYVHRCLDRLEMKLVHVLAIGCCKCKSSASLSGFPSCNAAKSLSRDVSTARRDIHCNTQECTSKQISLHLVLFNTQQKAKVTE